MYKYKTLEVEWRLGESLICILKGVIWIINCKLYLQYLIKLNLSLTCLDAMIQDSSRLFYRLCYPCTRYQAEPKL